MLLTAGTELPADETRWSLQPKWDGVRVLVAVRRGCAVVTSRHGTNLTGLAPVAEERLAALPEGTVLDGELVAFGAGHGGSVQQDFDRVRHAVFAKRADEALTVVVWDVVQAGSDDLRRRSWDDRQVVLRELVAQDSHCVMRCPTLVLDRRTLEHLLAVGFEGAVTKRRGSRYRDGERSSSWVKHKARLEVAAEVVRIAEDGTGRRALVTDDAGVRSWCSDPTRSSVGDLVRVQFARRDLNRSLRDARLVVDGSRHGR